MLLQQAYDVFIADRRINGCKPKTLAFYHDSAGAFLRFVADSDPHLPVGAVVKFVPPFFISLQERNLSDTTRHTYTGEVCAPSCVFSTQKATCQMK